MQIRMSTETERRVENLLAKSTQTSSTSGTSNTFTSTSKQSSPHVVNGNDESTAQVDASKKKFSLELRDLQNSKKVFMKVPVS